MSVVAFTFGSFGDILSILQIANNVRKLLGESAGASAEYQQLISELDTSRVALSLVLGVSQLKDTSPISQEARLAIQQCVHTSRNIIANLDFEISKYRDSLKKGGTGRMMIDSWRKMGWAFFKVDYLVQAREQLSDQSRKIKILLEVSNAITVTHINDVVQSSHTTILEISRCVQGIPQVLGYSWEGGLNPANQPIMFLDMLGQNIRLPIDLCGSSEEFDDFLRFYFRNRVGRHLVERRSYDIYSSSDNVEILPEEWTLKPGSSICMNARIQRASNPERDSSTAICPSCDYKNRRSPETGITCSYCQIWFMTSNSTIEEVKEDSQHRDGDVRVSHPDKFNRDPSGSRRASNSALSDRTKPSSTQTPSLRHQEDNESHLRYLRRIRVLSTIPRRGALVGTVSAAETQHKAVEQKHCPPPSRVFTGRADILSIMDAHFSSDSTNEQLMFVLYGLGGSGKSEIMRRFVADSQVQTENHPPRFSEVLYVDASSPATLAVDLANISIAKKLGETANDTINWLVRTRDEAWLLVLDHANDVTLNLQPFIPRCSHGNIIITTRNRQLEFYDKSIEVSRMSEADAKELFLRRSLTANPQNPKTDMLVTQIVEELDFLALGIIQAAAYLQINKTCTLERYLSIFRSECHNLLENTPHGISASNSFRVPSPKQSLSFSFAPSYTHKILIPALHYGFTTYIHTMYGGGMRKQQGSWQWRNMKELVEKKHPSTLTSMGNLALTYSSQDRWTEAEKLEVTVTDTSKRVLGEEEPRTLIAKTNLARTYRKQGRLGEAQKLEATKQETEAHGEVHRIQVSRLFARNASPVPFGCTVVSDMPSSYE